MDKYFLPIILISSFLGTSDFAQVFREGGCSDTACPSGSQYKGNGFYRSKTGNISSMVVDQAEVLVHEASSKKGTDSAKQMIASNSFVVVDQAEHLALLELSTREMVSAKTTN